MALYDYAAEIAALNPVIWWRLHDNSGSLVADSSGNNHTASYLGNDQQWGLPGIINDITAKAVRFNQSGNIYNAGIIYNPAAGFPTDAFTITWVERDFTPAAGRTLFSYAVTGQADEFRLVRQAVNTFNIFIKGSSTTMTMIAGTAADAGARSRHMTFIWTGSTASLWVNGTEAVSVGVGVNTLVASGSFVVCQDQDAVGGSFVANDAFRTTMSEISIFTGSLPVTTIRELAASAQTAYYTSNIISSSVDRNSLDADVNDFVVSEKVLYFQRVWDVSNSVWCYYNSSVVTTTPATSQTTPNHSGNITNHSIVNIVKNYQIP